MSDAVPDDAVPSDGAPTAPLGPVPSGLSGPPLEGTTVPEAVQRVAADRRVEPEPLWRNECGGLTYRVGGVVVKWSPADGIPLAPEAARLGWLQGRHPVPRLIEHDADAVGEWMITSAIRAENATTDGWRARPELAVAAIAQGLRALHAVPLPERPDALWAYDTSSWVTRMPAQLGPRPALEHPVLVHGDACAPNTLLDAGGWFLAHVDVGDVAVGDPWADLAVASMSLDWNYGEGWQDAFFAAYGVERDEERIRWYRALWHAES